MPPDDDSRHDDARLLTAYPPRFLDVFDGTLTMAGWKRSSLFVWEREKNIGRAITVEAIRLGRGWSGPLRLLGGGYRYAIYGNDDRSDDDEIYVDSAAIPDIPLTGAAPIATANALLAFATRDRLLLAARAAWIIGDAWPHVGRLPLSPAWQQAGDYTRRAGIWTQRWTGGTGETLLTYLAFSPAEDNPCLGFERHRDLTDGTTLLASGKLPLDPLGDVSGTFVALLALIGQSDDHR